MPDPADPGVAMSDAGSTDEEVALYDPTDLDGRVTGHAPRSQVRAHNLPHAATAVAVRDHLGRIYVHRRTDTKDVFPGAHDVWAGGVVGAGEEPDVAAHRELAEELGLAPMTLRPLFREWYADEHTTYLAHIYETDYDEARDGPIRHQPAEVADGWWMTVPELQAKLSDPEWPFVPDGRHCFELYVHRGLAARSPGSEPQ